MTIDRLEQLKAFVRQKPDDPFPLYGLAMEYKKQGMREDARESFERLMERFPDYVAAYYHAGQLMETMGQRQKAIDIWREGVAACDKTGDGKTRAEIEDCLSAVE